MLTSPEEQSMPPSDSDADDSVSGTVESVADTKNGDVDKLLLGEEYATWTKTDLLWLQVVVILLIVQPFYSPVSELLTHTLFPSLPRTFFEQWMYRVSRQWILIGIALGMMWWSGEAWSAFGIQKPKWSIDTIAGCLTYIVKRATALVCVDLFSGVILQLYGPKFPGLHPSHLKWVERPNGVVGALALLVLAVSIGVAEEFMIRGLLLSRLRCLTESSIWSVVLSSTAFGLMHWYGGLIFIVHAFIAGLVYGAAFILLGRIWPSVFAHSFTDFDALLYQG